MFYVGKGTKARAAEHQKDQVKELREYRAMIQREESKAERIDSILQSGEQVPAIVLASGFETESAAYKAEAMAMELIGRLLSAHSLHPLTNAIPGHGQSLGMSASGTATGVREPILRGSANAPTNVEGDAEQRWRTVAESLRLSTSRRVLIDEVISEPAILVKGTSEDSTAGSHLPDDTRLPGFEEFGDRVRPLLWEMIPGSEYNRRAYDPDDPWNDHEARERARRYWPLKEETANGWLTERAAAPKHLLLAIPGNGGTTVRYAWEIDYTGTWERFREGHPRWGIPLGASVIDHPAHGVCLIENRDGKTMQVLAGYASGVRLLHGPGDNQ